MVFTWFHINHLAMSDCKSGSIISKHRLSKVTERVSDMCCHSYLLYGQNTFITMLAFKPYMYVLMAERCILHYMLISSSRGVNNNDIPTLELNGKEIEWVPQSKLLGILINDDLVWDAHVHHIHSKASKMIHYLRELKRSGLLQSDPIRIFLALVRSVSKYGCHVWLTGLTKA